MNSFWCCDSRTMEFPNFLLYTDHIPFTCSHARSNCMLPLHSSSRIHARLGFTFTRCTIVDALDWHNQIFLGHQIVFGDKLCETATQICFILEIVEYSPMMEVGMREDAIDATAHRPQFADRRFFDGYSVADRRWTIAIRKWHLLHFFQREKLIPKRQCNRRIALFTCWENICNYSVSKRHRPRCVACNRWPDTLSAFYGQHKGISTVRWLSFEYMSMGRIAIASEQPARLVPCKIVCQQKKIRVAWIRNWLFCKGDIARHIKKHTSSVHISIRPRLVHLALSKSVQYWTGHVWSTAG